MPPLNSWVWIQDKEEGYLPVKYVGEDAKDIHVLDQSSRRFTVSRKDLYKEVLHNEHALAIPNLLNLLVRPSPSLPFLSLSFLLTSLTFL
jgi:hypothetical protein